MSRLIEMVSVQAGQHLLHQKKHPGVQLPSDCSLSTKCNRRRVLGRSWEEWEDGEAVDRGPGRAWETQFRQVNWLEQKGQEKVGAPSSDLMGGERVGRKGEDLDWQQG